MHVTNVLAAAAGLLPALTAALPAGNSSAPAAGASSPWAVAPEVASASNTTVRATSSSAAAVKKCLQQYPFQQVYAGDSSYNTLTKPENENLPSYQAFAIALPSSAAGAADVVKCVAAAKGAQKLSVRGGHHSYQAYDLGGQDGTVVLDLRKFDSISIDKASKTATVGAGVRLGALAKALSDAGFALPHGTCAYVGVSGHGLGGGYGFTTSKWGFLMDHITSMQVVLPTTGAVVTASASENPDLFWGLRGGGQANFGAVLSFTYALEDAPSQMVDFSYAYKSNGDCVAALLAFQDVLTASNSSHAFPADITAELLWITEAAAQGGPACTLSGQHIGVTKAQHAQIFQRFRTAQQAHGGNDYDPSNTQVTAYTSYAKSLLDPNVMGSFDTSNPNGDHEPYYAKSLIHPNGVAYTKAQASSLMSQLNAVSTYAGTGGSISFAGFGPQSAANVASSTSAYPHRDTLFLYQFYSYGATSSSQRATIEQQFETLQQTAIGIAPNNAGWGAYVNYVDRQQDNWASAYYGSSLAKLKQLKQQYDPNNLLDYAQGLAHA